MFLRFITRPLSILLLLGILGLGFAQDILAGHGDVTVEGKIELAADGDRNGNGQIDAGDTMLFSFDVRNQTNQTFTTVQIKTGVDLGLLYDIRILEPGVMGYFNENNTTINLAYLVLLPDSRYTVKFLGTAKYYTGGERTISIFPRLSKTAPDEFFGTTIQNDKMSQVIHPWVGPLPCWLTFHRQPCFNDPNAPVFVPPGALDSSESIPPEPQPTLPSSSSSSNDSGGGGGGGGGGEEPQPAPKTGKVLGAKTSSCVTRTKDVKAKDFIQNKTVPAVVERLFGQVFGKKITPAESTYWKGRARCDKPAEGTLKGAMYFQKAKGRSMPVVSKK